MKKIGVFILMFIALNSFAQEKLSLEQCYVLAEGNYPIAKQKTLLATQNELDLEVIKTGKLPKIDFQAQATYQSDVISLPFTSPASTITPPNKDQYQATVSVNQLIYDGGLIDASLAEKSAFLKTQQKQVEVSLYQLKEQVNKFYFSIRFYRKNGNCYLLKKRNWKPH